jgi:hypothetical protein
VTPSVSNALVISSGADSNNNASSIDSSFTLQDTTAAVGGTSVASGGAWLVQAFPAALTPTWTFAGSGDNAACMASFKP